MTGENDQAWAGQGPYRDADPFNAQTFVIEQMLAGVWTSGPVKVMAVHDGFVDVQPLINQIDGYGQATPHGVIYNMPTFRLQGGPCAVVIDPAVGDIGLAVYGHRDASSVKAARAPANPGSRRTHSPADGFYIGGFLNGAPSTLIQMTSGGIVITSSGTVTVNAPMTNIPGMVTIGGVGATPVQLADGSPSTTLKAV